MISNYLKSIYSICAKQSSYIGFFALLVLLSSCGKAPEHSKYIPKNTSLVVCFNLESMTSKAENWQDIFGSVFFANLNLNTENKAGEIKKNLQNSGIDFKSNLYFFADALNEKEDDYFVLTFKLEDESKFDNFLRTVPSEKPNIQSFSDMRYTMLDNKTILGWANKIAILLAKNTKTNESELKEKLRKLRDLPQDQSLLASNPQFGQMQKSKYDIATWINLESFNKLVKQSLKKYPIPITIDLKQNYIAALTHFEKGEIVSDIKFYNLNESLKNYQDIVKKGISAKLINNIPFASPIVILGLGLNTVGVKKMFDNFGGIFFEKQIVNTTGVSSGEIIEMLSGDMLTILKDIKVKDVTTDEIDTKTGEPQTLTEQKADYQFLFSLGINKQATLAKVFEKFTEDGFFIKKNGFFIEPKSMTYFVEKDNILYATASEPIKDEILRGEKVQLDKKMPLNGEKSFFVLSADVSENTRKKLPSELFSGDMFSEGIAKNIETPMESFSLNTLPMKNNVSETQVKVAFKNKEKNALLQLINIFKQEKQPAVLQ